MGDVKPFKVDVPEEALDDLRRRIVSTRWPESECVEDWTQGIPLAYTREVAEYWASGYDWRRAEKQLNRFDHYKTNIDGLDIHFIHQKSPHPEAFPLVMTHGWPGSVVEFLKVIDQLVDPTAHGGKAEDAFHVVCPSLPGFGFSGKPTKAGWGVKATAKAWDQLMVRLGYGAGYGAQGGDWGAAVTTQIGCNGGHCKAIHVNMAIAKPPPEAMKDPTEEEQAVLGQLKYYQEWDSGYSKQQSTRPQTIGYALVDSPVGQMAWILEKFWSWMDCNGHPENTLTRDELLDNIMIYWVTATGASSARLYWESFGKFTDDKVELPTGIASFPKDVIQSPRSWCEKVYNITHWTNMPAGGHFAAFEQPKLFVDDVRAFFRTIR